MSSNGAQTAFLEALERHRGILVKVGAGYCRNPADRDDLIQEIVAQLWRSFPRYDGRAKFSTWMYRVALNVAISFDRSERRRTQSVELSDPAMFVAYEKAQELEANDALESVLEHVNQLDDLSRALVILYLDDKPYADIAEILGISETNVATKLTRIKDRLKRAMAAHPTY
jgi:RNA polymerase sigma factor (sigma-70 family)